MVECTITKDEVKELVGSRFFTKGEVLKGYIVVTSLGVFKDAQGRFLFDSREQANRAFYNVMRWRTVYKYLRDRDTNWYMNRNQHPDPSMVWKKIKSILIKECNYRVIEL